MTDTNQARNIESEQTFTEAPAIREERLPSGVTPAVRETRAANEEVMRRARRRLRSIVWDDGGLKPFRVA